MLKSVEAIVKQRKGINSRISLGNLLFIYINNKYLIILDLGGATVEFGSSLLSLAGAELNKSLANNLTILGNLQQKIKELHEEQVSCYINLQRKIL